MISYLLLLIVVITLFFIAVLIFAKNYRLNTNQYFFIFLLAVIIWILANYFENSETLRSQAEILLKIDFASAALLAAFFYLFCHSFLVEEIEAIKKYPIYFIAAFLATISFFDLVIKDVSFVENAIQFQKAALFYLYAAAIISFFGLGFWNLMDKYKKVKSAIEKLQIFYILAGLMVSISVAGILNLILPQFFVLPVEISRLGIYSIIIFCILTTYAILRHHLFNVKVIATEVFTFAIWIFLLIRTIIAPNLQEKIIDGGLLGLVVLFGVLLIRGVIKEVKQREKLEKITIELEAANERLRQLDEAKSEFLSIASHQLRTPITSIKGLLSMLLEDFWGPLNAEQKKYLTQVSQSNERLLRLIEDLLNISRIEAGGMQFDFKPVALEDITEDIVRELEPQALAKNLYLKFDKPKNLPKAKADNLKIRQVIQNLIDNSIKYTAKGGSAIQIKQQENNLLFSIKDTGIGLPIGQHLFEKFQRGQKATNQHTEGIGLGLYLADKIIKAHNGKIWAESEGEDKGSVFYFTLPIA